LTDTTLLLCDTTIECSQQMTAMYQFKSYVKNSTDCFFEDRSKPHDHNLSVFDPLIIDRVAGEIIRLVASMCVHVHLFGVGTLLFEPFDL